MQSEQQLAALYKQRHLNLTQRNVLGTMILLGMGCCMFGLALVLSTSQNLLSLISYAAGFVCIAVSAVLLLLKRISAFAVSVVLTAYFCFVYVPVDWFLNGGLSGSTPFVSLVMIVMIVLLLSRRVQLAMLGAYLLTLAALTAHSAVHAAEIGAGAGGLLLQSASFAVSALLLSYSLMFLLRKYERMYEHFLDSSIKDTLTGVFSRRVLDDVMDMGETQFREKQADYAVVMLDVDRLKELNDTHGHAVGDDVLKNFAACVRSSVRASDYVLRYGGDEFLLMLPGATEQTVQAVYRRIEKAVAENTGLQGEFEITFSRGLAHRSAHESPERLIEAADKRMYAYKQAM